MSEVTASPRPLGRRWRESAASTGGRVRPVAYASCVAELDYAFVADFARVEPNGTLTAISASWTNLVVRSFPAGRRLAIAGRVRGHIDEPSIPVRVTMSGPDAKVIFTFDFTVSPGESAQPYGEGLIGHLFAIDTMMPLTSPGVHSIEVFIDNVLARTLKFEARQGLP